MTQEADMRLIALESKLNEVLFKLAELDENSNGDKRYSVSEVCKRLKIGRRRLETLILNFHLGIETRRVHYPSGWLNPKITYKQLKAIEKALKLSRGDV
mgnify:CR=1 FL=1